MKIYGAPRRRIREFVTEELTEEQIAKRSEQVALFKKMLKYYKITAREFSRLSGVPEGTVYTWTSKVTSSCPPGWAMRFLAVIGKFPEVRKHLEK